MVKLLWLVCVLSQFVKLDKIRHTGLDGSCSSKGYRVIFAIILVYLAQLGIATKCSLNLFGTYIKRQAECIPVSILIECTFNGNITILPVFYFIHLFLIKSKVFSNRYLYSYGYLCCRYSCIIRCKRDTIRLSYPH